ncbi:toxin-antitoxin system YwqK family antitoxin [Algoriphagus sp.]|uniref:toxin-antitoxin system YwqK family antitoxin n=1 Tax=Algoriphagus sp. TaxID=1872435 RepID=UPI0025CC21B4|nr:toxin-antitoxin system YwqK family antitoxin [Algoriphagus sp.]
MLTIVFSLVFSLFLNTYTEPHYFYFGSSNLIGVGNLEEGKKIGEWKVYPKKVPQETQESIFDPADPQLFEKEFNKEFPIFVINFLDDLPDGVFQENYPSGSIKIVAFFENGELENDFKEFYETGELKLSGQLDKGKKVGEWLEYFESGEVKSSVSYIDGIIEGDVFYYSPQGGLELKVSYSQGKQNGLYQTFYPDGEIKQKGNFINGIPEGEWVSLTSDGKLQFQGTFQNGLRDGNWIEEVDILPEYFRKGTYSKGLKEGEWFVVDSEGEILQSENYQTGTLVSVMEIRFSDKLNRKQMVKNGNGKRIYFDKEGFIKAEGKITKGKKSGKWFFYYSNTDKLASTGKLVGSERIGTWDFYSFDGELIDQIEYTAVTDSIEESNSSTASSFNPTNFSNDALNSSFNSFDPFNRANYVQNYLRY